MENEGRSTASEKVDGQQEGIILIYSHFMKHRFYRCMDLFCGIKEEPISYS